MNNVQNCNPYINMLSSQTYKSYLHTKYETEIVKREVFKRTSLKRHSDLISDSVVRGLVLSPF
jgi:hypothetical protein